MSKRATTYHSPRTSRRRRALGQHFLADAAAAARIISAFAPSPEDRILEIGPGRGALTAALLAAGARVTAIEIDTDLAERLQDRFGGSPGFRLVRADVLTCDLIELAGGGPARVLGNLPYSITGPVLSQLFAAARVLTDMTLMLQREVVNRIVAAPGSRVYGSLSVLSQYFTDPRSLFTIGPGAFSPPPAVSSAVVAMPFRRPRELTGEQESHYPRFVRMLFAHRRQTLLNNLKAAGIRARREALERAGIDAGRRAETLSRQECLALHRELALLV
ncbi:MAG TPA: 16S rRNA (adenine(1518)-N(6)/adenine(1519)-N(6))-dimethyltransferase RsmA [Candidatus Polarisedimenticolia bacterium]|nr:16S rRNA (adenine(1518)-N(6)/adenine(1519)-N(6))-dimethyltransferase RsmA [Candidatus Polarisedimenticolia bacterium]